MALSQIGGMGDASLGRLRIRGLWRHRFVNRGVLAKDEYDRSERMTDGQYGSSDRSERTIVPSVSIGVMFAKSWGFVASRITRKLVEGIAQKLSLKELQGNVSWRAGCRISDVVSAWSMGIQLWWHDGSVCCSMYSPVVAIAPLHRSIHSRNTSASSSGLMPCTNSWAEVGSSWKLSGLVSQVWKDEKD
jgi:hypothetical protein